MLRFVISAPQGIAGVAWKNREGGMEWHTESRVHIGSDKYALLGGDHHNSEDIQRA